MSLNCSAAACEIATLAIALLAAFNGAPKPGETSSESCVNAVLITNFPPML